MVSIDYGIARSLVAPTKHGAYFDIAGIPQFGNYAADWWYLSSIACEEWQSKGVALMTLQTVRYCIVSSVSRHLIAVFVDFSLLVLSTGYIGSGEE